MAKRSFIILLIVLLSGVAALIWFVQNNGKSITTDPFSVIPEDACFVIEPVNLPDFLSSVTEGNRLFTILEKTGGLAGFCEKVKNLRNFIGGKEAREIFEKNRGIISFHPVEGGRIAPLLSMNLGQRSKYRQMLEILRSSGGTEMAGISVKGVDINPFSLKDGQSRDTVYLTFRSGLLLCSSSSSLIQRAALQREPGSGIRNVPGFTRIMSAAGRKEDKIYVIFRNFATLLRPLIGNRAPLIAEKFEKLAGCAEADIHINASGLILSGYIESLDSSDYLYRYKSRQTGKLTSYEILPSDVLLFETMLLKDNSTDPAGISECDELTSTLATGLSPFMGDEITRALIDQKDDQGSESNIVIFKLSNRQMAEQVLTENCSRWAKKEDIRKSDYISYFQPDDQTKIPVYITPFKNLASAFLKGFVSAEGDSLYAFADNYLVTGNSFAAIKRVLYDNILNKTLANDLAYRDFESTMPSRAGYYFYCQPSGIITYLSSFISDTLADMLKANSSLLRKFQATGYQFAASNEMIYNTLSISLGDTAREASGAEWETMLDTSASIKPFFFTNHNTGAREIFIQDYKNNVYLINSAGRVLWKVSPGEKILGNVYMIDYFGNGKYQLLFAGRNNLYLLDRNGNYVEKFPARLRSPASGPPALFDYDGTGEFRILIPGEDRLIYAYDKSGNVVKGWKPFRTGGLVKTEIRLFRISGKDYLIAADDRSIYFLDRTGNQRIRLKEQAVRAAGSEIRLDNNNYPGIVFTSPEGIITKVAFDGTVSKTAVRKFSVDHSFDFFDIDGDGFGEYVFSDSGKLYLYDNKRSEIFARDFGTAYLEGPVFFIFSATDRKIGLTDAKRKLIYLVDRKGNIMNGFPLKGASVFSIGKLSEKGDFRLIVGGEDNFLYNYKIEPDN
ncbi:MAG: hypothetical protein ABR974_12330 [Bacteroidales bacterium]